MNQLLKKLNFTAQSPLLVVNPPPDFLSQWHQAAPNTQFITDLQTESRVDFALAFVQRQEEIDELAPRLANTVAGDGLLWFAYPKGTSKNYRCDFNRDTGWAILGELGFEGVRQIAIDADWTALRFRRAEYIKILKRSASRTMSAAGRAKQSGEPSA